ncbi:MAG TPA: AMP-binding protein, partial [Candidatus Binatia bacterium]
MSRQRRLSRPRIKRATGSASRSLSARFEQQVAQHGASIALKNHNRVLTYGQLNRAANRLGHAILTGSPGRDEPIALLFKHGTALITANLAVLKSGRPFVQIDNKLPRPRAAGIIEDAGARLIVTDNEHFGFARELAGRER